MSSRAWPSFRNLGDRGTTMHNGRTVRTRPSPNRQRAEASPSARNMLPASLRIRCSQPGRTTSSSQGASKHGTSSHPHDSCTRRRARRDAVSPIPGQAQRPAIRYQGRMLPKAIQPGILQAPAAIRRWGCLCRAQAGAGPSAGHPASSESRGRSDILSERTSS